MAEALNYRMNLVIDPKNVIKANRELRAMERYFERIQGRVMKIGRTRMAPEIVLNDMASKSLDRLLNKINRVRSQMINASGDMNLNVKHKQISDQPAKVKASPVAQPDFTPVIQAVQLNTFALNENSGLVSNLITALGSLKVGGEAKEEKPKSVLDRIKQGAGGLKNAGEGLKNLPEANAKRREFMQNWRDTKDTTGSNRRQRLVNRARNVYRSKGILAKTGGEFLEVAGKSVEGLIGGGQDIVGSFQGMGSSPASGSSSIISSAASEVGEGGAGIAGKFLKSASKKILGPLSIAADAASISQMEPGKERTQAIGSAVGGAVGSTVGGAIGSFLLPGVGTIIGSTLGGMAGDFLGGKAGGWISDHSDKIKEKASAVSGWFSDVFGISKKVEPVKDFSQKPAIMTSSSALANPQGPPKPTATPNTNSIIAPSGTLIPNQASPAGTGYVPAPFIGPVTSFGPVPVTGPGSGIKAAAGIHKATAIKGKETPQLVQISPEQITTLSGFLKDFKTETNNSYNLPPGAVQVTVHEEHPVDIEGLIVQIGQRLRAEFQKATQNQKPTPKVYA